MTGKVSPCECHLQKDVHYYYIWKSKKSVMRSMTRVRQMPHCIKLRVLVFTLRTWEIKGIFKLEKDPVRLTRVKDYFDFPENKELECSQEVAKR